MGYILSYQNFTVEAIRDAVAYALNLETQNQARKVSMAFRDRMHSPAETAVWWVEHVAKTGGAQFGKSNAINLSAFEYHSLDVLVVLVSTIFVFNVLLVLLIKKVCCSKRQNEAKKQKTN